jgi:formyltetrahydrofolate-dependent phosphoribosylglycinamide formyltransferase
MVEKKGIKRIAIFASGKGSNAEKIIDYFAGLSDQVEISLIVCNKPEAGVLEIARKKNIPYLVIDKEKFFRGNGYVDELKERKIDFIVLAGFLWKIPVALIRSFQNKIVNIHPALLPAFGGKGMYGHHVHEAVIAARKKESGISIHLVDELYDHGRILFQAIYKLSEDETPESLAAQISKLEHSHYPRVIAALIGVQNIVKS